MFITCQTRMENNLQDKIASQRQRRARKNLEENEKVAYEDKKKDGKKDKKESKKRNQKAKEMEDHTNGVKEGSF